MYIKACQRFVLGSESYLRLSLRSGYCARRPTQHKSRHPFQPFLVADSGAAPALSQASLRRGSHNMAGAYLFLARAHPASALSFRAFR